MQALPILPGNSILASAISMVLTTKHRPVVETNMVGRSTHRDQIFGIISCDRWATPHWHKRTQVCTCDSVVALLSSVIRITTRAVWSSSTQTLLWEIRPSDVQSSPSYHHSIRDCTPMIISLLWEPTRSVVIIRSLRKIYT